MLEFLLLQIIAAEKVYVAEILKQLSATEFATQEGTLYPLLSNDAPRRASWDYEWKESEAGPPRNITNSPRKAGNNCVKHWSMGQDQRHDKKTGTNNKSKANPTMNKVITIHLVDV